jgi:catalase
VAPKPIRPTMPIRLTNSPEIIRAAYRARRDDTDFVQPGAMYREVMSDPDREHLLTNIIGHASHGPGLDPDVATRVGDYCRQVDLDLGAKVAKDLDHRS